MRILVTDIVGDGREEKCQNQQASISWTNKVRMFMWLIRDCSVSY